MTHRTPDQTFPSRRGAVSFSLLSLVVACGGQSAVSGGAGGSTGGAGGSIGVAGHAGSGGSIGVAGHAGSGGSIGVAGHAGSGGSTSGPCPAALPTNGAACTPPYAATGFATSECSYGDDLRPQCRAVATCTSGAWEVTTPTCAAPALPAACPTPPPSESSTCSDTTLSCWYGDGTRCACSGCRGGSEYPICQTIDPPQWHCATPATGCPTVMPQAGTACSTPGASCGPDCTLTITCTNGVWQWGGGMCPVCAAPDTPIATPNGEQPIASLRAGDLVYSVDHNAIVAVPLLKVAHTAVSQHRVVRVALEGGRVLEISPGHPTADGRTFGDLLAGGQLDPEHSVQSADLVPYTYDATYDILPASSTGTYFAAGALIGSTMFKR